MALIGTLRYMNMERTLTLKWQKKKEYGRVDICERHGQRGRESLAGTIEVVRLNRRKLAATTHLALVSAGESWNRESDRESELAAQIWVLESAGGKESAPHNRITFHGWRASSWLVVYTAATHPTAEEPMGGRHVLAQSRSSSQGHTTHSGAVWYNTKDTLRPTNVNLPLPIGPC